MIVIKILSLFDGISCGMVALERAGINVDRYVAYEIDKYAIEISNKNYPKIEHQGDVTTADFTQYKGFDLLIGGSPCTYWSVAKKDRETTSDGMGFKLFLEFVRAKNETGCKYFLYENNFSIHKDIKSEISKHLGVEPIMINSALVSAQQRKRCYWTNIPNVTQPEDKKIFLKDILESGIFINDIKNKSHTLTASYYKAGINPFSEYSTDKVRPRVAEPICVAQRGRYFESGTRSKKCDGGTYQAIKPRKDGKTNCLATVKKDNLICEPIRLGQIGKGGQGQRIYSVMGKSVTLSANGGGQGVKTGLYKLDLPDGDYIIRKLTPVEAERLQTLPENYTNHVSSTQRYKGIGNGWTVDVIAHIFKNLNGGNNNG